MAPMQPAFVFAKGEQVIRTTVQALLNAFADDEILFEHRADQIIVFLPVALGFSVLGASGISIWHWKIQVSGPVGMIAWI